eukprot:3933090-Rhodomonas_salina.1
MQSGTTLQTDRECHHSRQAQPASSARGWQSPGAHHQVHMTGKAVSKHIRLRTTVSCRYHSQTPAPLTMKLRAVPVVSYSLNAGSKVNMYMPL